MNFSIVKLLKIEKTGKILNKKNIFLSNEKSKKRMKNDDRFEMIRNEKR